MSELTRYRDMQEKLRSVAHIARLLNRGRRMFAGVIGRPDQRAKTRCCLPNLDVRTPGAEQVIVI